MNAQTAIAQISPLGEVPADGEFFNREISWLEFNLRVLHEALDERTPLLERVFFLSIFNSNLDEYFQKRVGGLKRQIAAGIMGTGPDGLSARETLSQIRTAVLNMLELQAKAFTEDIRPALAEEGIHLLKWAELTESERAYAAKYFRLNMFPVLTPLAVDPGHPFPFISNLSTSLGVMLHSPGESDGELQFARVKVPRVLPKWILLQDGAATDSSNNTTAISDGVMRFVHAQDVIMHHLEELFPGMQIESVMPFRITRNADTERDEEDAEDLLELIEQELRDRRFAPVVRLEIGPTREEKMIRFLMNELELDDADVYCNPAELDYTDLSPVFSLNIPRLKYRPWSSVVPTRLRDVEADIFTVIRQGDVLVHHPYESFTASVERFIRTAASDPKVMAIKQTLYRTSSDSPFIPELIRAAEAGKQVICLVELKARFDEERNIQVAQMLEKAGVHVVYGLVGYKTHTKTAMVVRQESDGMRTYCHIGTGNYNSKTAGLYTDLGLLTCDPAITDEIIELFHYLTGRSQKKNYNKLLVAPINMRDRFEQMIDREIQHCEAWKQRGGDPGDPNRPRIVAKMNSLEDRKMCRKLYEASQAGVSIDLIVRGFCCLRPGIAGMSENIRVTSVIGRFLEHSRIFHFHNAGQGEYYIGSADWMYRNLNNRVECITPIEQPHLQDRLRLILDVMLNDRRQCWEMQPDGSYVQRKPVDDADGGDGTQETLMMLALRESGRVLPDE